MEWEDEYQKNPKPTGRKKCLQDDKKCLQDMEKALLALLYITYIYYYNILHVIYITRILHTHDKFTAKHLNFPLAKAILRELLHPQTPEELVSGQSWVPAAGASQSPGPVNSRPIFFCPLWILEWKFLQILQNSCRSCLSLAGEQRRWFQAQYLTQLNYTWLLFAPHSLKRIPLPDLSVSALLKLSTFIHMYG